jgi:hypothetical protein
MLRIVPSVIMIVVLTSVGVAQAAPSITLATLRERIVAARTQTRVSPITPNPAHMKPADAWMFSGLRYAVSEKCFRMGDTSTVAHPKPCVGGDLSSSTTIVIFGDSAVGNWTPALRAAGKIHHWRIASLQYEGCMVAFLDSESEKCQSFHRRLPATIAALHPQVVIGVGGTTSYGADFDASFVQGVADAIGAVRAVSPSSKFVVWGTSPLLPLAGPACVLARPTSVNTCGVPFRSEETAPRTFGATATRDWRAARLAKAKFVPVDRLFCANSWCPVVVDHTLVYIDTMHISERYSLSLEPLVSSTITSVLNSTNSAG